MYDSTQHAYLCYSPCYFLSSQRYDSFGSTGGGFNGSSSIGEGIYASVSTSGGVDAPRFGRRGIDSFSSKGVSYYMLYQLLY